MADYLAFKHTPDYYKLSDPIALQQSPHLQKYKDFENSREYTNYVRFHNTSAIQEYERLKAKISTPEFQSKNEFWQNADRWALSDDQALERRFNEIANSPDARHFFAWQADYHYDNPHVKSVVSYMDERKANTGGKNTTVGNGMIITTRRQNCRAVAWDTSKGFVERDFEFTSDVVNGYNLAKEEYCGIRVKMRCTGNVNHAFWLTSGSKLPHINVALIKGKTIEVGVHDARGDYYYTTVTGINPSKYYIYSIYQKNGYLIWRINNIEVFRTRNIIAELRFSPCFSSFIPADKVDATEGQLDIAWVEVYK